MIAVRPLLVVIAVLMLSPPVRAQPGDLTLVWRTVRSRHFAVHYHQPLGPLARKVAQVAERARTTIARSIGHAPRELTHILLTDNTEGANGSATVVPYNQIRLYASAPEDLTPLIDYEDWIAELVTHEYTHIGHLNTISGVPAIINAVFGKVYAPNSAVPRWLIEGLATQQESEHTAGGRLRSTVFDMYLREDALSGRLLGLDQLSNSVDRWLGGYTWYLYGSHFVQFIAERYGTDALAQFADHFGRQIVPFGLNRIALRITGNSFVELYEEFLDTLRSEARTARDAVQNEGPMEGEPITSNGGQLLSPRFLDDQRIIYFSSSGHSVGQLRVVNLGSGEDLKLVRVSGDAHVAVHPDGRHLVYSSTGVVRDLYRRYDLFTRDLDTGEEGRQTFGARAREPDISPNGRSVAFTLHRLATRHLAIADLEDIEGTTRIIVHSRPFEQIYSPRWSPDGNAIAFSAWSRPGFRDIRVLDLVTGVVENVTHDRAVDTTPAWSPDGRFLFFSSDRTGIANIYAYEIRTRQTWQVTHVIRGASQPAVAPDGRTLAYVDYGSEGFDLHAMPLDPSRFRPAKDYVDDRPAPADDEVVPALESARYRPGETLLPRSYSVELTQNSFGSELGISTDGSDLVGYHSYSARIGVGLERGEVNVDLAWAFYRTPVPLRMRLFRHEAQRGGLEVAGEPSPWIEGSIGGELRASYEFGGRYHTENVNLTYAVSGTDKAAPFEGRLDPNDPPPVLPERGVFTNLRLGWSYSDTVRTSFDISNSGGRFLFLGVGVSEPSLGSRFRALSFTYGVTQYVTLPWFRHHVLAVRYAGGIAGGDSGRRGSFSVGGFPSQDVLDAIVEDAHFGGVALRGYPPGFRRGSQFHLLQTEYRFPLFRLDRGIGTFPGYLNRMSGAVFADYGDAFNGEADLETFRLGAGAQLLLDFTLGYIRTLTLRFGLAHGFHGGGTTQVYVHLGVPF